MGGVATHSRCRNPIPRVKGVPTWTEVMYFTNGSPLHQLGAFVGYLVASCFVKARMPMWSHMHIDCLPLEMQLGERGGWNFTFGFTSLKR